MRSSSSRNSWSWSGLVMLISASTSVFLYSTAAFRRRIFAALTVFGIPGWTRSLSMIIPSTISESSIAPPTRFSTLTFSVSTVPSASATRVIARTIKSQSFSLDASAFLPVIAVPAILERISLSFAFTSTAMVWRSSCAFSAAWRYPRVITVGWTSCSRSSSDFFRSSPAITTAEVVPSPTSSSWVFATSTIIFAAGCSISISLRMVTPSLVMTTSPMVSTSILSMPFGPRVVLTAPATAFAAAMFMLWASRPRVREPPSLRIRIGCPPSCADMISISKYSVAYRVMYAD